jgi:hypothetical protein
MFVTRDFCGFADIIAFSADQTAAVQATSASNVAGRVAKIEAEPRAWLWLQDPGREIWVVGWKRYATAVDRKFWRPTVKVVGTQRFSLATVRAAKKLIVAA